MIKKHLAVLIASLLTISLTSSSFAAWGWGSHKRGSGFFREKTSRELALTQQQKDAIAIEEKALENELSPLRRSAADIRAKMSEELRKDNPDKNVLFGYIDRMNSNMGSIQKKKVEYVLWFKSQLTAQQKAKFDSLLEKRSRQNKGASDKNGKGLKCRP